MRAELYFIAELDDGEPRILVDGPFIKYSLAQLQISYQMSPKNCVVVSLEMDLTQP